MLTKNGSEIRGNTPSGSSKSISPSGIVRKLPGVSLSREGRPREVEGKDRVSRLHCPDNQARSDQPERAPNLVTAMRENGGLLLAIAAHDLRHPAAALMMVSDLLADATRYTASREQVELIDAIHSISEVMLRSVDDILDFAQGESGFLVWLRAERLTVASIVERCVSMNHASADKSHIRLCFVQEGEPLPVLADPTKLSKVFNNLIGNAIKFCQPGGEIEVRIVAWCGRGSGFRSR